MKLTVNICLQGGKNGGQGLACWKIFLHAWNNFTPSMCALHLAGLYLLPRVIFRRGNCNNANIFFQQPSPMFLFLFCFF